MKRKNLLLLLLFIGTIGSSCTKILDQEPRNSTYAGEFWQSAKDVSSAVAGNYALLRDAITSGNFNDIPRYFVYGDAVPGNYFTMKAWGDGIETVQTGNFTGQYNIESYGNWTKYYKVIAMSNLILKRAASMDEDMLSDVGDPAKFRNEALGQAYFVRALTYFMLTRTWGDVPLVLESYDDPLNAPQLPRTSKTEVLAQVEADCNAALGLLAWNYPDISQAKVTANKGSVYALLAHMYLWRATTTNLSSDQPVMSDVESAGKAITSLKMSGGYSQVDTSNYYSTFVGKSPEGIFEIATSETTWEGSNRHIASFFLRKQFISYNSETDSRFFVKPDYLTNHYKKYGTGVIDWIWHDGQWVWNEAAWEWQWHEGYWEQNEVQSDRITDIRYINNFTDLSISEPTCIKYHNVNYRTPNNAYISNNIIIFRYSDMLLLEAEIALYKNNEAAAADIINSFRRRNDHLAVNGGLVSPNATKSEVMKEYIIERGREMYLEGQIYYDLIRTRQYPQFITWLSEDRFKQGGFYWPVAPDLFKNNSLLAQTPYWKGKI